MDAELDPELLSGLESGLKGAPSSTPLVIAIDGPSGAGKSSVSRGVAQALGLRYLDTGATYRALTWDLLRRGVEPTDADAIAALVESGDLPSLEVGTDPAAPTIVVDGVDAEPAIRGPEVTTAVSPVSAVPALRRHLVEFQRSLIGSGGIVVEGRDIGTVVAPGAHVKIFLTADADARAVRRAAEGVTGDDPAATRAALERRDRADSSRAASPLSQAPDAYPVDTTGHDLPGVIGLVLAIVERSTGHRAARAPRPRSSVDADADSTEPVLVLPASRSDAAHR